ncbi:phage tail tape measure protein, TP901 family [Owenweeksia hongkongensis DSM 17368]|uniref:Phage tail tape measure protein, TP901 family n=1 Tax=Owenweeksia hongkongensis (strain DSM 17368 / CIP 108786 / JCM 12287 / NRRL B-23963 / UST20020801) TaxID=926562 RepID=G8R3Q7_OWEHD|nr:phage tail tape measure protein [Owenweeksia hongkongensis]AEV34144.1 phage tail tape measure protein, TP901 family [Owenweeksia hongkongensis DSM 17368]
MAKTISDETLKLNVVINGDDAQAELLKLEKTQRELKQSNEDLRLEKVRLVKQGKKNTQEYKNLTAEQRKNTEAMDQNKVKMHQLQEQIGITSLTIGQLRSKAAELRLSLKHAIPDSARYRELQAELNQVNNRLGHLKVQGKASGNALTRMFNSVGKASKILFAVTAAVSGLVFALTPLVNMSAELSDAQADVQKTTNLTKEQVRDLTLELDNFDTRTPRLELLKLAEEAGRLGKDSTKDILAFTETANMLKVALGDDLGGEEAIRDIGKLTEQYRVGTKYGTDFGNAMEKLGSGINQVAQSGNNQASFLVDYLKRLSGISDQVNINAQDQLGYAATFDEAGQSVETAATATSKALVNMFDDTETYARIAGMGIQDFTELMNTDANAAFIKFLEGLNGNNEGMAVMVEKLNELDIDGARAVSVLSSLAANTEKLKVRQAQANQAMAAGTSLVNEYNIKNENLAGNLERIKNAAYEAFISGGLVKGIENIAKSLAKAITTTETFEDKTRKTQAAINAEIEALKNGEFSVENRNRLIGEINTKYGEYLPNLIDEKDSYEDIVSLQRQMNAEFEKKILYAAYEEEIKNAIEAQANALKSIYEQEKQIAKAKNERNLGQQDLAPTDADLQEGVLESLKQLNKDVVENTDDTKQEIEEKYKFMFDQLGSSFDEFREKMFGSGNEEDQEHQRKKAAEAASKEQIKAQEQIRQFLLKASENEEEIIRDKYAKLIALAKKYSVEDLPALLAQMQKDLDDYNAEEVRKNQEKWDKIREDEAAQAEDWLKEQQQLREKYGLITPEEELNEELKHLQDSLNVGLLTHEEYLKAVALLRDGYREDEAEKDRAAMQKKLQDYQAVATAFSDLVTSLKDFELSKIDEVDQKDYEVTQRRGESEEDFQKRREQAEARYTAAKEREEEKRHEIAKKYAYLEAISKVATIAISTAQSIMNAFATFPYPVALGISALLGATGAVQAGIALNEAAKINSYDDGLYDVIDHKGDRYKASQNENLPTGLYTKPTFSRSKNMLVAEKRPELVVDGLTTQKLINFRPDVIEAIQGMRQGSPQRVNSYNDGNYPSETPKATGTDTGLREALEMNTAVLNVLLQNGVNANIGDSKIREMKRLMSIDTKIEDQA